MRQGQVGADAVQRQDVGQRRDQLTGQPELAILDLGHGAVQGGEDGGVFLALLVHPFFQALDVTGFHHGFLVAQMGFDFGDQFHEVVREAFIGRHGNVRQPGAQLAARMA
jgi:hypothetical protein